MYGAWMGDPCMSSWMWNAGCGGYMWVSSYPWGWLPYHYGSWVYLGNRGWAWQPGGFQAWKPITPVIQAPPNFAAPRPPAGIVNGPVFVDRRPAVLRTSSNTFATNKLVIRNGSAGLGIPRGAIGNFHKISEQVEKRGFVNATVRPPAMSATRPVWQGNRTGYAQPAGMAGPSRAGQSSPGMHPSSAPASHPSFQPPPSFGGERGGFEPPAGKSGMGGGAPRR